ncbi:hypothetical protein PSPO01_13923 [Paraphaeosphaeria sporulosa]
MYTSTQWPGAFSPGKHERFCPATRLDKALPLRGRGVRRPTTDDRRPTTIPDHWNRRDCVEYSILGTIVLLLSNEPIWPELSSFAKVRALHMGMVMNPQPGRTAWDASETGGGKEENAIQRIMRRRYSSSSSNGPKTASSIGHVASSTRGPPTTKVVATKIQLLAHIVVNINTSRLTTIKAPPNRSIRIRSTAASSCALRPPEPKLIQYTQRHATYELVAVAFGASPHPSSNPAPLSYQRRPTSQTKCVAKVRLAVTPGGAR